MVLVVSSSPDETSDALVASSNTAQGHNRHDRSADRRTTEYAPGFNYDVRLWYIGRTPWADSEHRHQMSPLTHVASVKTSTLLMHGINDRTDTEPQSMMFFTAIRAKPRCTFKFPREPHGFREPRHATAIDPRRVSKT